uniref:Uncharacterized protein AlNc14C150G7499 n=1 Tax=Albugo laibachii Nc14 TaxID=890382 RepID=F0WLY6_9STRA|nr:conserved hypothetical protein [Albugo laibachii Nc14]|eukprot:CCA22313.1 conserved hypothetical protein [Albugo laibachii Nc14]
MQTAKSLPSLPQAQAQAYRCNDLTFRCHGDFCKAPPESLPDIFASLIHLPSTALDLNQRFPTSNRDILLARNVSAEASGLFHTAPKQLQMADQRLRLSVGQQKPCEYYKQVSVCANCHRIYSALSELRVTGFSGFPRKKRGHKKSARNLPEPLQAETDDLCQAQADPKEPEVVKEPAVISPETHIPLESLRKQLESANKTIQRLTAEKSHTKKVLDQAEANAYNLERSNTEYKTQLLSLQHELRDANALVETTRMDGQRDVEAAQKHKDHTIEYLQAQLALEIDCKQELGARVASLTISLEDQRLASRLAIKQQQDQEHQLVSRMQTEFQLEHELSMSQLASSQSKVAALCARISQLTQDLSIMTQRELQGAQHIEKYSLENHQLRAQVFEFESQAKTPEIDHKQMQVETLVRRLENERQAGESHSA